MIQKSKWFLQLRTVDKIELGFFYFFVLFLFYLLFCIRGGNSLDIIIAMITISVVVDGACELSEKGLLMSKSMSKRLKEPK